MRADKREGEIPDAGKQPPRRPERYQDERDRPPVLEEHKFDDKKHQHRIEDDLDGFFPLGNRDPGPQPTADTVTGRQKQAHYPQNLDPAGKDSQGHDRIDHDDEHLVHIGTHKVQPHHSVQQAALPGNQPQAG